MTHKIHVHIAHVFHILQKFKFIFYCWHIHTYQTSESYRDVVVTTHSITSNVTHCVLFKNRTPNLSESMVSFTNTSLVELFSNERDYFLPLLMLLYACMIIQITFYTAFFLLSKASSSSWLFRFFSSDNNVSWESIINLTRGVLHASLHTFV